MKNLILPMFVSVIMLTGCQTGNQNNREDTKLNVKDTLSDNKSILPKEFKTKTGKIFTVAESHPQGQSMSNISVAFAGDANSEIKFTDVDPINKVLVGDLDGNGFDEIYIITISAGSGSYGNAIGVASNADKSLSLVFIPPVEEKDLGKGGKFIGYEGHDEFEIIENSLIRTFPVKAAKPIKRVISYKMKAGEAGYILYINKSTDF